MSKQFWTSRRWNVNNMQRGNNDSDWKALIWRAADNSILNLRIGQRLLTFVDTHRIRA
jgi:hypothetical protein